MMPMTTAMTGITVDIIPNPMPEIMTVAGPVKPALATFFVGL